MQNCAIRDEVWFVYLFFHFGIQYLYIKIKVLIGVHPDVALKVSHLRRLRQIWIEAISTIAINCSA